MGRPPIGKPTLIRFRPGVPERIDAVLREGEARADLIRDAVDRELERREMAPSKALRIGAGATSGAKAHAPAPVPLPREAMREVRVLVSDKTWSRLIDEGVRNLVRGKRPGPKRQPPKGKR
jgi:hypothetical protein